MSKPDTPAPKSSSSPVLVPPQQVKCPLCHTEISCHTKDSAYFSCPSCRLFFHDEDDEPIRPVRQFLKDSEPQRALPLGTTGQLRGEPWRVIGIIGRAEKLHRQYQWREYVLLQTETGRQAQLAEFDGHWVFLEPIKEGYQVHGFSVMTPEGTFQLYNRYSPHTLYADGEFDWNILDDETLTCSEYINPPLMLAVEGQGKRMRQWYKGYHVDRSTLAEAFGISSGQLPSKKGIGAVEPAPGEKTWADMVPVTWMMVLLTLLAYGAIQLWHPSHPLLGERYVTSPTVSVLAPMTTVETTATPDEGKLIVTPSFELKSSTTALNIEIAADLNNQWLEIGGTLVNDGTGEIFEFSKGTEFYEGYEDGEHWTEGSREVEATLSAVPAGRYHLNLQPYTDHGQTVAFSVLVIENVALNSNLLLALLTLLAWPGIQALRRSHHNKTRWQNSDFGPEA